METKVERLRLYLTNELAEGTLSPLQIAICARVSGLCTDDCVNNRDLEIIKNTLADCVAANPFGAAASLVCKMLMEVEDAEEQEVV